MQYRTLCTEFGLTPMSAAKARAIGDLLPGGKTPPTNEFARNRRGALQ
jgi:hypothetical protein